MCPYISPGVVILRGTYFLYRYCGGNGELLTDIWDTHVPCVMLAIGTVAVCPRWHGQVLSRRLAACIVKDKLCIARLPCGYLDGKIEYKLNFDVPAIKLALFREW
jgi:hypothetical protein